MKGLRRAVGVGGREKRAHHSHGVRPRIHAHRRVPFVDPSERHDRRPPPTQPRSLRLIRRFSAPSPTPRLPCPFSLANRRPGSPGRRRPRRSAPRSTSSVRVRRYRHPRAPPAVGLARCRPAAARPRCTPSAPTSRARRGVAVDDERRPEPRASPAAASTRRRAGSPARAACPAAARTGSHAEAGPAPPARRLDDPVVAERRVGHEDDARLQGAAPLAATAGGSTQLAPARRARATPSGSRGSARRGTRRVRFSPAASSCAASNFWASRQSASPGVSSSCSSASGVCPHCMGAVATPARRPPERGAAGASTR